MPRILKQCALMLVLFLPLTAAAQTLFPINGVSDPAAAPVVPKGPFMIAGGNQAMIWRIDQSTGLVSYCIRDIVSNDPALLKQRPPICSAWGR